MLTDEDRTALESFLKLAPGEWAICPTCFVPSDLCLDQEARGLSELRRMELFRKPRWAIRLTVFGRIALKGKISDDKRRYEPKPGPQQPTAR